MKKNKIISVIALFAIIALAGTLLVACEKPKGDAISPVHYDASFGTSIKDTYFSLKPVDYVFQQLPYKAWTSESSWTATYTKTALIQKIQTANAISDNDLDLTSNAGNTIIWIAIFFAVFCYWLRSVLELRGKTASVYVCIVVLVLIGLIIYAIFQGISPFGNALYIDNATDRACHVRIDQGEISLPAKTYELVRLDNGPHTLEIVFESGNRTGSKTVINVENAGLLIYNIEGYNTYAQQTGSYVRKQ